MTFPLKGFRDNLLLNFFFLPIILTIFHIFSKIINKLYKKYVKNNFDIYDHIKVNRCCLHGKMFYDGAASDSGTIGNKYIVMT